MKQTIIAIVALIVLVAGGYYAYQQGVNPRTIDFGTSTIDMVGTSTTTVLSDGTYSVDATKSTAGWEGSKTIIANWIDRGSIKVASGSVTVASSTITDATVVFDMTSISASQTGNGSEADKVGKLATHLKSDDFFNTEKYPTAIFKATGLTLTSNGEQTITGNLTIRDVTKPISIPVTVTEEDGVVVVTGKATVDRTVYNVKFGSSKFFQNLGDNVISDEFKLDFKVYLNKTA